MRKIKMICVAMLLLFVLQGCQLGVQQNQNLQENNTKFIYTTIYEVYAHTLALSQGVEDNSIKLLIQPQATCIRNYTLSSWDRMKLEGSYALVLAGSSLESFEAQVKESAKELIVITLGDGIPQLGSEEAIQETDLPDHYQGANPWIWLDGALVLHQVEALYDALITIDPQNRAIYTANYNSYAQKLKELHAWYKSQLSVLEGKKVCIMHEAMPYLTESIGLDIALTIKREPSDDITGVDLEDVIGNIKGANVEFCLLEKQAPQSLLDALTAAGIRYATIDTMVSSPADGNIDGYLDKVRNNAQALLDAIN